MHDPDWAVIGSAMFAWLPITLVLLAASCLWRNGRARRAYILAVLVVMGAVWFGIYQWSRMPGPHCYDDNGVTVACSDFM